MHTPITDAFTKRKDVEYKGSLLTDREMKIQDIPPKCLRSIPFMFLNEEETLIAVLHRHPRLPGQRFQIREWKRDNSGSMGWVCIEGGTMKGVLQKLRQVR